MNETHTRMIGGAYYEYEATFVNGKFEMKLVRSFVPPPPTPEELVRIERIAAYDRKAREERILREAEEILHERAKSTV